MIAKKLKDYLDSWKVKYTVVTHSPAYTAHEIAQCAHIRGHALAKTVMVRIDGAMAMAVLPSNHRIMLDDLRDIAHTDDVEFATEKDFKVYFPDCEVGAMPPFGNLYDMSTYVAPDLADEDEIAFNAGSHTELIKMLYADFERLVRPRVARFTT